MSSPLPRRAHEALVRRFAAAHRDRPGGEVAVGHHNRNYVVPLDWPLALLLGRMPFGTRAKFRTPLDAVEVVPRIWPSEAEVLRAVTRHLGEVPRCLADFGDWSIHSYVPGRPLSEEIPHGPVGEELLRSFARFFARTACVPESELPPLPADWPVSGDTQSFLRWLIDFTELRVHRHNRRRFGALFRAVGVRTDAMTAFAGRLPLLAPRPFCLIHTDVHRANVVVVRPGRTAVIDWELSMFGDPVHELATHLVRMEYDEAEHDRMRDLWADELTEAGRAELTKGLDTDLPVYLDFEYAQSVFPDIMRAALALPAAPADEDFEAAAAPVRRALRRAAGPLRLKGVPGTGRVVTALRAWHAGDVGERFSGAGTAGADPQLRSLAGWLGLRAEPVRTSSIQAGPDLA
ncbi:phosphotransferase family protein [Actinomycetota bacterium Odt1-20B]